MDYLRDAQNYQCDKDKNIVLAFADNARNTFPRQRNMVRSANNSSRSGSAILQKRMELQMVQYHNTIHIGNGCRLLLLCSDNGTFGCQYAYGSELARRCLFSAIVPQPRTIRLCSTTIRRNICLAYGIRSRRHRTLYGKNKIR